VKPTGKQCKEGEEIGGQNSAAHLVERLCSGVCSTLTDLTVVAIDIAYLYTFASKRQCFGGHVKETRNQETSLSPDLVKLRSKVIESTVPRTTGNKQIRGGTVEES
jgi:hypothetical protein